MKRTLEFWSIIYISFYLGIGAIFVGHQQPQDRHLEPIGIYKLNHPSEISPLDIAWGMLAQVNMERVMTDLHRLTGEEPICFGNGCYTINHRLTGSEGLQWAKDYIYEELVRLGYSVELRNWSSEGYIDQNIIARKSGKVTPDDEIYFVAHIDGVYPDGAQCSPAADDNASGVVGVLELARILSKYSFNRTIVLLFSTGEEQGVLGVKSYVDQLSHEELSAIRYVVNVDMVGYDSDLDGAMQLWSGDHTPSLGFVQSLSEIIHAYGLDLKPSIVTGCN
jgi:hypothetical protein